MRNILHPEEIKTTVAGLLSIAAAVGGSLVFGFQGLHMLVQLAIIALFVMGLYFLAPQKVRDYLNIFKKVAEQIKE